MILINDNQLRNGQIYFYFLIFFFFSQKNEIVNYPPKDGPVVAFGDSLVKGVGASEDLGFVSVLQGKIGEEIVYLDAPFEIENEEVLEEAKHRGKNVKLGKPFRTPGGPKKFAVYVKSKNGGVKKVTFGDPNLKIRNKNKGAAKSFRARHKCDQKKDRTTAGYWSCNVGRYAKQLGLSSSNSW
jgi:hypothetical protein